MFGQMVIGFALGVASTIKKPTLPQQRDNRQAKRQEALQALQKEVINITNSNDAAKIKNYISEAIKEPAATAQVITPNGVKVDISTGAGVDTIRSSAFELASIAIKATEISENRNLTATELKNILWESFNSVGNSQQIQRLR